MTYADVLSTGRKPKSEERRAARYKVQRTLKVVITVVVLSCEAALTRRPLFFLSRSRSAVARRGQPPRRDRERRQVDEVVPRVVGVGRSACVREHAVAERAARRERERQEEGDQIQLEAVRDERAHAHGGREAHVRDLDARGLVREQARERDRLGGQARHQERLRRARGARRRHQRDGAHEAREELRLVHPE